MEGSTWSKETLELKSLSLWDENARFPDKYFSKTEEELIQYFLSKKDFKVVDLAKEIVAELDTTTRKNCSATPRWQKYSYRRK